MVERWHKQFSPERFLSRIDLEELIKKNESYNESKVDTLGRPCYLCNGLQGPGILLNDKSYLCKLCLEKVSRMTYPEMYEILYREYLLAAEARKVARASLIALGRAPRMCFSRDSLSGRRRHSETCLCSLSRVSRTLAARLPMSGFEVKSALRGSNDFQTHRLLTFPIKILKMQAKEILIFP